MISLLIGCIINNFIMNFIQKITIFVENENTTIENKELLQRYTHFSILFFLDLLILKK